jgi:hypothetical protein
MGLKSDIINFNPFPGLRPFAPEDSDLFFGRKSECDDVILKLLNNRYVTITGTPGSGKSSLIGGGIIPGIVSSGIGAGSQWKIIAFNPGNDPFLNFAEAVSRVAANQEHSKNEAVAILPELHNSDNIHKVLRKFFPAENILLVIDQLEELFINASGNQGASVLRFIDYLIKSAGRYDEHIFIIAALRSDYLGECARYKGFAGLVNSSTYLLTDPVIENLKEMVEGPVRVAGAVIDPELTSALLEDVSDLHYQLPVLQHAMMRTWAHWRETCSSDSLVGREIYESIGTVRHSVSFHANEIYDTLNERDKLICASMFMTITRKGPDNKGVRHPTDLKTIKNIAGCSTDELIRVADQFRSKSCSFITPAITAGLNENSIIDLQTDCIMYAWNRLDEWIDKEAESMQIYLRLSEASALYQHGKAGLYKPPELQAAINWREETKPELAWAEQYNPAFERAMVYLRTSEKNYREEEENRIRLQKNASRRSRRILTIFGIVLFVAVGLIFLEYLKTSAAERQVFIAENQRIEALKQKTISDSSATVASRLLLVSDSMADAAVKEAQRAKDDKLNAEKQKSLAEYSVNEVIRQKTLAIEERDGARRLRMQSVGKAMSLKSLQLAGQKDLQSLLAYQAYLFNKKNNGPDNDADIYAGLYNIGLHYGNVNFKSFKAHKGDVRSIAFVPGKDEFFTSGNDGQVLRWSLSKKSQELQVVYSGSDIIEVLAVSPDASWLACGSSGSSIRMIPLKGNKEGYEMSGHKGAVKSLIFSYDGKYLFSAALDGKVLKWDLAARTSINIATGLMEITSIDISSKGNHLAGVSADGNVVVWDPENSNHNFRIETAGRKIKVAKFNPSNNLLALGDTDGNVELWDVEQNKKISEVKAHNSPVNDIRFNARLMQMATAGDDKKINIFNIKEPSDLSDPPLVMPDNDGFVLVMEFSPDGQIIVSGGAGDGNNLKSRPANNDFLAADICNTISRNMTKDEWNAYVGKDIPFEKTCLPGNLNIKVEPVSGNK